MMKSKLLGDRAALSNHTLRKPSPPSRLRWAAAAVVMALGVCGSTGAWALGLGRMNVLSALGEPLRAEIDIPQINAEEAANLKASIPNPAAFRSAGVEYSTVLTGAQISLQKRSDGTYFLRLTSEKSVNEPFIDLILETRWASGQIVRDYTLLFDPVTTKTAAPIAPVAAQVTAPSVAPAVAIPVTPRATTPAPIAPTAATPPPPAPTKTTPPPPPSPPPAPIAAAPKVMPAPATITPPKNKDTAEEKQQVKVQAGDTAIKIAAANKPKEVSLDQMLVALLRANPNAFIDGNVNRIKAGSVLDLPSAEQVSGLTGAEVRKTLSVQSANFNEYRKKLAETIPPTQVAAADRQASGSLQTKVDDKKPAAASPDKLTLSQSSVQGKAPETKVIEDRQKKDSGARAAELEKNLKDLAALQAKTATGLPGAAPGTKLGTASPLPSVATGALPGTQPVAAASSAPATPPPAAATPAPAVTAAPAALPVASGAVPVASSAASAALPTASVASAAASAEAPAVPASAAVSLPATPASAIKAVPKKPVEEPSMVDDMVAMLTDDPLIPAGLAGLLLLGGGYAYYHFRLRKPRKLHPLDSSFIESRLQPDSFFGSSGGQHIDTNDTGEEIGGGSSLAYSPSQLDAAGDVDPVAEADVYLAYGRDLQAEEILKEALRINPARIAIHGKLLEIYAKRRDVRSFEAAAQDAYKLSHGEGSEWERICEFGRDLDGKNPLYKSTATTSSHAAARSDLDMVGAAFGNSTLPPPINTDYADPEPHSIDLDLGDFGISHSPAPAPSAPPPSFEVSLPPAVAPAAPAMPVMPSPEPLDLSLPDLSFDISIPPAAPAPAPVAAAPAPTAAPAPALDSGMIEFDLSSLSMDFGTPAPAASPAAAEPDFSSEGDDPMATKLELAQEFHAIGDTEGARALVEEVVAISSGPLKAKAQRFLAELS